MTTTRFVKRGGLQTFEACVLGRLPALLTRLLDAPKHPRAEHAAVIPNKPGVYLFSDTNGKPIYVGQSRNLRARLAQHTRPSSPENAASFAFNIAKREAEGRKVDISGFHRKALSRRPDWSRLIAAVNSAGAVVATA